MKSKYTVESLEPVVRSSVSYMEVLRKLSISFTGGNNAYIRKKIRELGIDTSHFLGLRANSGAHHKGGSEKLGWEEVLVLNRIGRREKLSTLRRAFQESGVAEKCAECGLLQKWNGKPITLHIDHMNGNPVDNRKKNLRYLCPNCHSQTENYGKCKEWNNQWKDRTAKPTGRTKRRIKKNVDGVPVSTYVPK
jgi:predicted RNA-binding Zn-ribbon protein involved in translation (DUF1610 family)